MCKKIVMTMILGIVVTLVKSQVPEKIAYQAVIRNFDGTVITNTSVNLRISLINETNNSNLYSEEHTVTTSGQGIVNLEIGGGAQQTGSFSSIDWALDNIKLKIEINKNSSWVEVGTANLYSVPYALFAADGNKGEPGVGIDNVILNSDSTLTINFTNSTSYTTPVKIIGTKGERGVQGVQGIPGFTPTGLKNETLVHDGASWISNSKLMFDIDNNRLGIVTNAPSATLDVNGSIRVRGSMLDKNNFLGGMGNVLTSTVDGVSWQEPLVGSGLTGKLAVWNGAKSLSNLSNVSFVNSLEVVGKQTTNPDDPIFEVKNSAGEVIFGVYQEGVRINIKDSTITKGAKGGFAVGGLSTQGKVGSVEYFRITPDSARVYVKDNAEAKGAKGGFAVGGLSTQGKSLIYKDLLFIADDSARVFIKENVGKGAKGGFAVGGLSTQGKAYSENFLQLTPSNYFIGHQSGKLITTGQYNSILGYMAGVGLTTGNYNSFIGYNAGLSNSTGSSNVFIGYECGKANTTGYSNVVIGKSSAINSNGNNNIVIGENAGFSLTSGIHNTLIGTNAAYSLTNQDYNVMIGTSAGFHINSLGWSGSFNTFMGINSGYKIATSRDNTFIGTNSGMWIENGARNTFVGIDAGRSGDEHNNGYTVNDNTIFGCKAGYNILNGSANLFLGTEAGFANQSGSGNVFIGYRAGYFESGSNKLYISNTSVGDPLIYGDFLSKKVGINTTALTSTFNVGGDLTVSGAINTPSGINGKVNNLSIVPFNYTATSDIVELTSLSIRLMYDYDRHSICIFNNNSTLNCGYRIIKQTSSITSLIGTIPPLDKAEVMIFSGTGEGCELHFYDFTGSSYVSVWLTYIGSRVVGHYIKY